MTNIRITGEHKWKFIKRGNCWVETWFEPDIQGKPQQKQRFLTKEEYQKERADAQESKPE